MSTKGIFIDDDLHLSLKLACHDENVTMQEVAETVVSKWLKGKSRLVPRREGPVHRTKNVWIDEDLHHRFKRECMSAGRAMTDVADFLLRKWVDAAETETATG